MHVALSTYWLQVGNLLVAEVAIKVGLNVPLDT